MVGEVLVSGGLGRLSENQRLGPSRLFGSILEHRLPPSPLAGAETGCVREMVRFLLTSFPQS